MPERPLSEQLDEAIDGLLGGTLQPGSPDSTLSALMKIVDRLQYMPDDGFKMRLGRELQTEFHRRTSRPFPLVWNRLLATLPRYTRSLHSSP